MRWFSVVEALPGGRRHLLARIACTSDAEAADLLTAAMFPDAEVWQANRFVAKLPPLQFASPGKQDTTGI